MRRTCVAPSRTLSSQPHAGAAAATGSSGDSMGQLGISREALLAAGLPQHTINALYRAMAAHAGTAGGAGGNCVVFARTREAKRFCKTYRHTSLPLHEADAHTKRTPHPPLLLH